MAPAKTVPDRFSNRRDRKVSVLDKYNRKRDSNKSFGGGDFGGGDFGGNKFGGGNTNNNHRTSSGNFGIFSGSGGSSGSNGGNGGGNNPGSGSDSGGSNNGGSNGDGFSSSRGGSNNDGSSSNGGGSSSNGGGSNSGGVNSNGNTVTQGGANPGFTQFPPSSTSASTASTISLFSLLSPTGEAQFSTTTSFSSMSLSLQPFTPTPTLPTSSTDTPSPTSENVVSSLAPLDPKAIHHVTLPLGSIVAIILGILFCITISCVIVVITRPKFGCLGRLWKRSRPSGTFAKFDTLEPKIFRSSSRLYRPYNPPTRPMSQSLLNLAAYRFGTQETQNVDIPSRQINPASNGPSPPTTDEDFQTQIYSTSTPATFSSKSKSSISRSQSGTSSQKISRFLSMMDAFHFERDSAVDSGQISPALSDHLPL